MSEKNGNECIGIILGHTAAAKQRSSMPEVRGGKVRKAKGRKALKTGGVVKEKEVKGTMFEYCMCPTGAPIRSFCSVPSLDLTHTLQDCHQANNTSPARSPTSVS
jgi:hypothetical protein